MAHVCRVCPAMIRRYESGMSLVATAVAVGASPSSVRHWLLLHGVALRGYTTSGRQHQHTCTDRCRAITGAYQGGASLEAIGLQHKVSRERIRQILRAHDVPIRNSGAITRHHQCDDLCAAVLADPAPSVSRLADRLNVSWYLIGRRMKIHKIASVRRIEHQCSDRCRALIAHLQTHLQDTTYTAAAKLSIPSAWMAVFRRHHHDFWRVRPYVVVDGRRVRT